MATWQHFNKSKINDKTLSVIHFMREWNGASQIASLIFEELAKSYYGSANFYTVNFEEEKKLSTELGVMEVPAILFFRNGELIDHAIGLTSKNALIAKIETALSNANTTNFFKS